MQTAMQNHIQWLYDNQLELNIPIEVIEDAKDRLEMEKQQIGDAIIEELKEWGAPYLFEESSMNSWAEKRMKYITETYRSKGSDEIKTY